MIKLFVIFAVLLASTATAFAQRSLLNDVSFEQKLSAAIAADATFKDETGQTVRIGDLLQDRPTVLMVGFYECPMLCDPLLQNLASSLKKLELSAGKDFNVITLSISPSETPELAAAKKAELVKAYGRPETAAGWHCLTGTTAMIDQFTGSVGFHYAPLPGGQFSHPAGLIILTPGGHVNRYLLGMTFQARDMRLAIVESSQGKIGTLSDAVLLRCYHYDPATGKYGFAIQAALQTAGCATALLLFGTIGFLGYRYRQKAGVHT